MPTSHVINTHCPEMKSILDLNDYTFDIPVYQRGFRWTRQQVKELIQDLYEFIKDKNKTTYCLQNITVREKKDDNGHVVYEVIDGQQRLTAIWILVTAFMDCEKYSDEELPLYSLVYQEKGNLTKYVRELTNMVKKAPGQTQLLEQPHPNDIDSCFIHDAFTYIINEYKLGTLGYSKILNAIFNDDLLLREKEIKVIWNVIDSGEEDEAEQTKYVIERFSNLNANKIPLTESELIKAHFINRLDENRVEQFSHQWEEIERGLNNEEFWRFISSDKDEETRMDMLFRIHLSRMNIDFSGHHNLSKIVSNRLANSDQALEEWKQVTQIYNTLYDWFNDYYCYHLVGLIIAVESAESGVIIKDIYNEYTHTTKEKFKTYLKKRIRKEEIFNTLFSSKNHDDWTIDKSEDIALTDGAVAYGKSNNNMIKAILLLFNISLLVNAYCINEENSAERFSFKIFKNEKNPLEIEHINPQHLEGKNAYNQNYTAADKQEWAEKTLDIIDASPERDELASSVSKANWNNKNNTLIARLEDAAHLHAIGNLTLVDKNLNIRYGDNFFREKRSNILAARFGQPIPNAPDEYYKQSVILPGTMWVFMRQYIDARDADRWVAKDQKAYIACMQDSIFTLLKPDQTAEETEVTPNETAE